MIDQRTRDYIEAEVRAGREPSFPCGCMGCRDTTDDGTRFGHCPCGMNCMCKCKLPHRRAFRQEIRHAVYQVKLKMKRESESQGG